MPLPSSGPLSLRDIVAEFGGSATPRLSDYYKGGQYVSFSANAPNVPTSGRLSLSNFYGASALDSTWLTAPGVEYEANTTQMPLPDGWSRQRAFGVVNQDAVIVSSPPPVGITDAANVNTLAVDMKMSHDFVFDPNKALHFVVASRHSGREYLGAGDNKCGAVIGGAVFEHGYYGIEGVELGDANNPNNNTFPWVWDQQLLPDVWWRVVIVTQYAAWGSSMKAMLFDESGNKVVDTNFYSVLPDADVFSAASSDNYATIAIIFDGPPTATFKFRNVRSYWSETPAGIPDTP